MIVVRYVFQAKFGRGDALVKALQQSGRELESQFAQVRGARVLTDLSGPFFTVVNELTFDSLAVWEEARPALFAQPAFQAMMQQIGDAIESGRTELYTLEEEG